MTFDELNEAAQLLTENPDYVSAPREIVFMIRIDYPLLRRFMSKRGYRRARAKWKREGFKKTLDIMLCPKTPQPQQ